MVIQQKGADILLFIRLSPSSSQSLLTSKIYNDNVQPRLIAHVKEVAENGKANKALIKLLAKKLNKPLNSFSLTYGETSRNKCVTIHNSHSTNINQKLGLDTE